MTNRPVGLCLAFAVTVMVGSASLHGQGPQAPISVKIQNSFTVGDQTMPAGVYNIQRMPAGVFLIRAAQGPETAKVSVVTRLARNGPVSATKLVFDKLPNGGFLLSEIWMPNEDGYLVGTGQGEHEHGIVEAESKK